jgi:hypothetical protein
VHPFSRQFWQGTVDARPLALLRIALGLVTLGDLLDRLPDFHAFYTDLGVLPRASLDVVRVMRLSVLSLSGSPSVIGVMFALGALAAITFTLGFHSPLANLATWLWAISVQERNLYVCDSGDTVLRLLLFFCLFADTGARYSLDVRLGRRAPLERIPALPVRAIQFQIALIYVVAYLWKYGGTWRDGSAVYRSLNAADFARPFGQWLGHFPSLCRLFTRFTLVSEAAFAPLVFSPIATRRLRALGLAGGVALHLGILATMRVGMFSLIMPLSYLAFIEPRSDDHSRAWNKWLAIFFAAVFAIVIADQIAQRSEWAVPKPLRAWLQLSGTWQHWNMFSPDPPYLDEKWQAPGTLADGSAVEVLSRAAPEMLPTPGWWYRRWYKLRSNLTTAPGPLTLGVGKFLCRRFGPGLVQFDLVMTDEPIRLPGESFGEPRRYEVLHQRCAP